MTKIRKSLLFSMADTLVGLPLQLAGTVILARLLTPQETGVFAVAAVFASFASTFRDFGVAEYLIQAKDLNATHLRAALTMNIITSWTVGLALFLLAPMAAEFYRHPGVAEVMRVQCLSFVIMPFGAVTMALFRRNLDFRPNFVASLLSNIATFSVGTACALAGMAYMSLAWCSLAGVVVTVATAFWFRPADLPRWPGLKGLGEVFHYGKFASGVYILGQLGKGAPEMVIGRTQGMAEVAMFSRGGGLVELFNRLVLRGVMPVCQPYFAADHRASGRITEGYLRSISYLTVVGWPALLVLGVASFPAVRILYGTQWLHAADLAKLLCAAAAIELVHALSKEALLAIGLAKRANGLQLGTQGLRVLGLLLVVPFGLEGAAWGMVAAAVAGLALSQATLRAPLALGWRALFQACRHSALVTLATAVPLAGLYALVRPSESNYLWWALAAGASAALAWAAALRAVDHPAWHDLLRLLGSLKAKLLRRGAPA